VDRGVDLAFGAVVAARFIAPALRQAIFVAGVGRDVGNAANRGSLCFSYSNPAASSSGLSGSGFIGLNMPALLPFYKNDYAFESFQFRMTGF
jgi:hypothetical protein